MSLKSDFKYVAFFEINGEESALVFDSSKNATAYMNTIIAEHEAAVKSIDTVGPGEHIVEFYGDVTIKMTVVKVPKDQVKFHLIKIENDKYVETRRFSNLLNALKFVQTEFRKYKKFSFVWSIGLGVYKLKKKNIEFKFLLSVVILDTETRVKEVMHQEIKGDDTYYEVLEIARGANEEEIKRAYRTKSKKVHPDFGGSAEAFKQVNEAYRKLMEEIKSGHADGILEETTEQVVTTVETMDTYPCIDIAVLIKKSQSGWDFIKKALGF